MIPGYLVAFGPWLGVLLVLNDALGQARALMASLKIIARAHQGVAA